METDAKPDMLTAAPLASAEGVRHAFFGRRGGVSTGLYSALNCGFGSSDDTRSVARNREIAMSALDLTPEQLVNAYQIHSNAVVQVTAPWRRQDAPKCDALVTKLPGLALGIMTADCVPVLLADPKARVIGAAHAGWRGALDGIVEAVVAAMAGLGAQRARILAGIGPAIAQDSYEVGPEFPAPFLDQAAGNADFFREGPRAGHPLFDLKGYVARNLEAAGVAAYQVLPQDTCAEDTRFFSYRRSCLQNEADYGRGLSAIALES